MTHFPFGGSYFFHFFLSNVGYPTYNNTVPV